MGIGRNDKCPCGSGKKYKKCCLKKTEYDSENIKDLLTAECFEYCINFNATMKTIAEERFHVVKMYEKINTEIKSIEGYMSNNSLTCFQSASLYFYIATYYSEMFNIYSQYKTFTICENKIKHSIHPQNNNDLVEIKPEEEKRIYDYKNGIASKANKYFILAENKIQQLPLTEDTRFSSLYLSIKLNLFNNISCITPLLTLLLIEDFESECKIKLDIYNSIQIEISYLAADFYLMKYRNNCPEELLSTIENNCNYRLNLIMYKLAKGHEDAPTIVNKEFVEEMLNKLKPLAKTTPNYIEFTRNNSSKYEISVKLLENTYCNLKKYIFEWDVVTKLVFPESLYHIYEEAKHNYSYSDNDNYEELYKISQTFNMLDKISYAILDYIKDNKTNEREYSLKYLYEKKDMTNYNEPNFRAVIIYISILNNFNNDSYFKEVGQATQLRNIITHKPLNLEKIDDEYMSQILNLKNKLSSYTLVFLLLAYSAFGIDYESKTS